MRRAFPWVLSIFCVHLGAQQTKLQPLDPFRLYQKQKEDEAKELEKGRLTKPHMDPRDLTTAPQAFAWLVMVGDNTDLAKNPYLQAVACTGSQSRVQQQLGAPSGASGSTTVTDKSDIPEVVAAAYESGSFTRTVNGNAVTFTVNGQGIYKFLTGQGLCVPEESGLENFSAFATFETSAPGMQTATAMDPTTGMNQKISFLPDPHTLNAAGAQWAINNPHDPSSPAFRGRFRDVVEMQVEATPAVDLQPTIRRIQADPRYQARVRTGPAPSRGTELADEERAAILASKEAALEVDPDLALHFARIVARSSSPESRRLRRLLANGDTAYSVKYAYNKPYNQHALHNVKAIVSFTPKNGPTSVTANFGMDLFGDGPQSGVRDIQASFSFQRTLPEIDGIPATVSLAAYYQYQNENALLVFPSGNSVQGINLPGSAATLLAPKGSIWIAQALLTLTKSNTVLVPIGFTYSNRTELLTGSEVKGHVGIQFNGLKELFDPDSR